MLVSCKRILRNRIINIFFSCFVSEEVIIKEIKPRVQRNLPILSVVFMNVVHSLFRIQYAGLKVNRTFTAIPSHVLTFPYYVHFVHRGKIHFTNLNMNL